MKIAYKTLLIVALTVTAIATISSCKKDSVSGEPHIDYIRVTSPESSDSLLVGAYQGALIALVGQNLEGATQIWFNDLQAPVTPTYNTATTILIRVPSDIPMEINNTLKIVFSSGRTLEYPFHVQISEPEVTLMDCEYVPAGSIATIHGKYFYAPVTVTFAGGVTGEVVSIDETNQLMEVKVPEGAQPGPVTVSTNFGETKSNFWFNDNRNIIVSSDPYTGWWNSSYVVTYPGASDPVKINGNYIRINKAIGGWAWTEVAGGPPDAMGPISKNIPDEAILKPQDYNLKFEINTIKPYNSNVIKIMVGLTNWNNDEYRWMPPYDTKGQWKTVTIPFEEMVAAYKNSGSSMVVSPDGYYTRILFHGPGDLDCDLCFDNFRIVPKIVK